MGRQGTPRRDATRTLDAYASAHKQRRRWVSVLSVLAALVVFCTVYALVTPASTMTNGAAVLPEGAQVPEGYTQQYTATDEQSGVAVTVHAPEGAVPEGATLKAELLPEDGEKYAEAKDAVAAEAGSDDGYGFAAMDIRFEDADGNEVEPNGDVYVAINADAILPEDADPDSVTVQHLAEDEAGAVASVDTVADVADDTEGVVSAVDTTNVRAAFSVDGFSTFTITWEKQWSYGWYTPELDVKIIDTDGNEISPTNTSLGQSEELDKATSIDDIIEFINDVDENDTLEEYDFVKAVVAWSEDSAADAAADSEDSGVQRLRYNEDRRAWQYSKGSSGNNSWSGFVYNQSLYFVYEKDQSETPGTITEEAGVNTYKTAVVKSDESGSYDLTLTIDGSRGSASKEQPVDVLFILDESTSMTWNWSGESRMARARSAIAQIIGYGNYNGLSDNENLDVEYALVGFDGGDGYYTGDVHSRVSGNWTNSAEELYRSLPNNYGGGTNYVAGFMKGEEVLEASTRKDALKVVIFISDGGPGYYYRNGNTYGTPNPSKLDGGYDPSALSAAATEVKNLEADYFYFVGVTGDVTNNVFQTIVNSAQVPETNKKWISALEPDDLLSAFKDIEQEISTFMATNVVINDKLSEYADFAVEEGTDPTFTVTISNGSDEWFGTVTANEGTVRFEDSNNKIYYAKVKYDITDKTFSLELPEDYELENGYTYSISTVIKPSSKAIQLGMNSDASSEESDEYTGTHAGDKGFWSNDNASAKVTYDANGMKGLSTPFPKPVIQVPESKTAKLTLTKTFDGLSDAEVQYLIFEKHFGFDVNYCIENPREDPQKDNKLTYMASDDEVSGFTLPDGKKVEDLNQGGGGFGIDAADYLSNKDITSYGPGGYTDSYTGATLKKNEDGNWVFSITLDVPVCDDNHFITVFEQHQEVPGYAKINDSNAEWTITNSSGVTKGTGKFVDGGGASNIYEDMNSELGSYEETKYRAQEDYVISEGALNRLKITGDTTISFTNHYVGKLDVSKVIDDSANEYSDASDEKYSITVQPANLDKLNLGDGGHGLNQKIVSIDIYNGNNLTWSGTKTLGTDGSFTLGLMPGQTARLSNMPAIQWKVTEDSAANSVSGYSLNVSYSDTNGDTANGYVVDNPIHWNGYDSGESIGSTLENDGIASVDSAVRDDNDHHVDYSSVAEVTVSNSYILNTIDVKKTDMEGRPLSGAAFRLYKIENNETWYYNPNGTDDNKWVDTTSYTDENWNSLNLTSDSVGMLTISGIDFEGEYYLEEIAAPEGYNRLQYKVKIAWQADGDSTLMASYVDEIGNPVSGSSGPTIDDGVIIIPNSTGGILPETGGSGTNLITVGGIALVAVAACGYGLRRSRERRGARS